MQLTELRLALAADDAGQLVRAAARPGDQLEVEVVAVAGGRRRRVAQPRPQLDGVSLEIAEGSAVALAGPSGSGKPLTWAYPTPAARDVGFRDVRSHVEHVDALTRVQDGDLTLRSVGTFDADRMGGRPRPGAPAIRTIQPSRLEARGAAAAHRLGGRPLLANGHLGGYLAQPPSLITTLAGARAFGGQLFPDFDPQRAISAIRVRVAGVAGIDAISRERIREAAQRIATATGLDVDIMGGASGAPTAVDLPAGRFGRPALAVLAGVVPATRARAVPLAAVRPAVLEARRAGGRARCRRSRSSTSCGRPAARRSAP